jgi:hypothetical protein
MSKEASTSIDEEKEKLESRGKIKVSDFCQRPIKPALQQFDYLSTKSAVFDEKTSHIG